MATIRRDAKAALELPINYGGGERAGAKEAGYTLMELLVVLAIIALLGAVAVPQLFKHVDRAKLDTTRTQIQNLSATLDVFRLDVGRYPTQEEGLEALLRQPSRAPGWNGPYLKQKDAPLDAWRRPIHYKSPGDHGEYDLYSLGADNAEGGEGVNKDISNW